MYNNSRITKRKRKMKSQVFKSAWELVKSLGLTLSEALKKAWKAFKLKSEMLTKPVYFQFKKKDGSIRNACGTLNADAFDYKYKGGKGNNSTVSYYDLDAKGFRCFKIENLV